MNDQNFQVGQVVKVSPVCRTDHITLVRIVKVWKNGVVEIGDLDGSGHKGRFNPSGKARGQSRWERSWIRPLAEGETVESIEADRAAKDAAVKADVERKAAERAEAIRVWWVADGRAIWNARTTLPEPFLGEIVYVIRYMDRDELRMPFVVLRNERRWDDKPVIEATIGGLTGREYKDEGKKFINTYSSSCTTGSTLEEVLYGICH